MASITHLTGRAVVLMIGAAAGFIGAPAIGKEVPPAALTELTACRTVTDATQRLACYDREVAEFEQAEATKAIVVVDREGVRRDRRSLFGLTLPRLSFFDADGEEAPTQVEGTIATATPTVGGKWLIALGDSVWQTTEVPTYRRDPEVGESVLIKKAALGSYLLSVAGRRGVRAMRVR